MIIVDKNIWECLSYVSSIDSIFINITMRPSQRKKLRDHLEEEGSSFLNEKSLPLRSRNQRNNYISKDPSHVSKNAFKYVPASKNTYLSILGGSDKDKPALREDYDSRNPPPATQRKDGCRPRKQECYQRDKEVLDLELEEYQRRGENKQRRQQQSGKKSKQPVDLDADDMILKDVELSKIEEQDLSFTDLKPAHNFKKDQKIEQSFDFKEEEVIHKSADESSDWIEPQKFEQEGKKEQKLRQIKLEKQKEKERQKEERPQSEVKQEKNKSEARVEQKVGSAQDESETIIMNKGFNNISKDSSQSSYWGQQKFLQQLESSNSNDNDSLSNANSESFISNIHNSTLHFPEHQQPSRREVKDEQAKLESILQEISNSGDFEDRDVILEIKSIKNIQQVIVKEVFVTRLGISLNLALSEEKIIVKRSEVEVEKLVEYISFYQIRVVHPRTFPNDPHSSAFRFCRLRVPPAERKSESRQSGFIKKGKRREEGSVEGKGGAGGLLRVVRVEVKCMNCDKASDVPVIESTNEAILSCRNCDQQMIAKIQQIAFSE